MSVSPAFLQTLSALSILSPAPWPPPVTQGVCSISLLSLDSIAGLAFNYVKYQKPVQAMVKVKKKNIEWECQWACGSGHGEKLRLISNCISGIQKFPSGYPDSHSRISGNVNCKKSVWGDITILRDELVEVEGGGFTVHVLYMLARLVLLCNTFCSV